MSKPSIRTVARDTESMTSDERLRNQQMKDQGAPPADYKGVYCHPQASVAPHYIPRPNEINHIHPEGASMCMGTDNLGPRSHGFGGSGETRSARIDLVVGRNGNNSSPVQYVDPDPFRDAARIYISQKTNCDQNFGIVEGKVGCPKATSAVVVKADSVRLIGRSGIKIVTGQGRKGETNALGGEPAKSGIDLIALNSDGTDAEGNPLLQPLVKGINISLALEELAFQISSVINSVAAFSAYQLAWNAAVASHNHISPAFAAPTTPSPLLPVAAQQNAKELAGKLMPDLVVARVNNATYVGNYLINSGPHYILSEFNNTN